MLEQLPDLVAFGAVESLLVQPMSDQPMSRPVEDMVETELERLVNQKTEILYDWCQRISCQALAFPPEIAISWCG